ncbi:hypothetical protein Y1Q_0004510 [Alligator mississippiensis]|uniref:Uncharacterized protein n=1 Tax=Alligator mississippiensis TaxID=8496 RepID=A0A151NYE2_ALLMI|nr:hypothetical protein Y1Q_0004510 [Alligator mississippiensis]
MCGLLQAAEKGMEKCVASQGLPGTTGQGPASTCSALAWPGPGKEVSGPAPSPSTGDKSEAVTGPGATQKSKASIPVGCFTLQCQETETPGPMLRA